MQKLNLKIALSSIAVLFFVACVPLKTFKEMEQQHNEVMAENRDLKKENQSLEVYKKELSAQNERLNKLNAQLAEDSLRLAKSMFNLKQELARSGKVNKELLAQLSETNAGDAKEIKDLLEQLQIFQNDLQAREDALTSAEGALLDKRAELEKAIADLKKAQTDIEARNKAIEERNKEIEERNKRILEMERMLQEKDSLMTALHQRVEQALKGFQGNGLDVHMKDGKLYVSLDEKLLFKSGQWAVDARGVSAITKLSEVLVENPDIQVMIEGHTDNVPYRGSTAIKDNWDLSVKRATSIVKIILKNKAIEPKRITAAGRGEFVPVDPANTPQARQKNRRTEIILTPDLDRVMKVLGGNE